MLKCVYVWVGGKIKMSARRVVLQLEKLLLGGVMRCNHGDVTSQEALVCFKGNWSFSIFVLKFDVVI